MRRGVRGSSLIEVAVGTAVASIVLVGTMNVWASTLRNERSIQTSLDMSRDTSIALRRVMETIRNGTNVTITDGGRTLSYQLPRLAVGADPITGEREYQIPITGDGTVRRFRVANGQLTEDGRAGVILDGIVLTDPDPNSSQYRQSYAPFQMTTIGARQAVTINLITLENVGGRQRYVRLKTTVLARNTL